MTKAISDTARLLVDEFLEPSRRAEATHRLAALGAQAIPAIASVLDGSARNPFGISLRSVSVEAARCALVSARLLGRPASPLEPLLRAELSAEHAGLKTEAAAALGGLGSVSDETLVALTGLLDSHADVALEAAAAIIRLELCEHPALLAALDTSPRARHTMGTARARSQSK